MTEHFFGLHGGHYDSPVERAAIEQIEREFANDRVAHTNHTEASGRERGWWSCRNRGNPFDGAVASAVLARFRALAGSMGE